MPPADYTADWTPAEEERFREHWIDPPPAIDGPVELAEHSPDWPAQYDHLATLIRATLGEQVLSLEHIGSTSVPGLTAKPIIDILLVVRDPARESEYVPPLEHAGFRLVLREPDWHEHHLFRRGPAPAANLHIYPPASPEITCHLRFRDHLRATPTDRTLYE